MITTLLYYVVVKLGLKFHTRQFSGSVCSPHGELKLPAARGILHSAIFGINQLIFQEADEALQRHLMVTVVL